ncbi:MAG: Sec-independent protein translocase protein TatB [Janthinobacterium lividum]
MFDFAWSEIALVGVVALIAIGPKDLPVAIKTVAEMVKKARRMAGEFQTHVDDMVKEANLHEVRDTIADIRRMDIKGKILSAVDGDGTLRKTIADNPFDIHPSPPPVPVHDLPQATDAPLPPLPEQMVSALPAHVIAAPGTVQGPPSFIPPAEASLGMPPPPPPPPAFIPPAAVAAVAPRRSSTYA